MKIALALFQVFIGIVGGSLGGMWFEGHYGDPVLMSVKTEIPAAMNYSVFCFSCGGGENRSSMISNIMIVGNDSWMAMSRKGFVPPRCRDVPDGAGCIDWLNPGEADWSAVLANRPTTPAIPRNPAWWENLIARFEVNRVKP